MAAIAAVFEVQHNLLADVIALAGAVGHQIKPFVRRERVYQGWGAQHIAHLLRAHARLQLAEHFLGDKVTLRDIDPVDTGKAQGAAASGGQQGCQTKDG